VQCKQQTNRPDENKNYACTDINVLYCIVPNIASMFSSVRIACRILYSYSPRKTTPETNYR